ncbi:MAG: glycosyltransferase [Acidimicrobiales bacterium]
MSETAPLGSVLIPAHNEAAVIRRCLDALFDGLHDGVAVAVVCNGCTDGTAESARLSGHPVSVIEIEQASKPAALRAGEAALPALPRLYLDADVVLSGAAAMCLIERLSEPDALAARPPISYRSEAASPLVRRYYRGRTGLPSVMGRVWGAGVYGLSAAGRSRFDGYPDLTAEDLFVDAHFGQDEVEIVACDPVAVMTPRRLADLLKIMRRTYRGKNEQGRQGGGATARELMQAAAAGRVAPLDALTYSAVAVLGRALAARSRSDGWERDESSRAA